ncbi:MAG: hypothetical protein ABH817_01130 [archaeon]
MKGRDIKDKISQGWLKVNLLFEVLGRPKEHVEEALKLVLEQIEKEEKVIMLEKRIHESKEIDELFSTFADIDILVENVFTLLQFVFRYMPSSIEITEPTEFKLGLADLNSFFNDLSARLHQYDMALKREKIKNDILEKKLAEKSN